MKQADLDLSLTTKRTRKREFLDEMNRVVPWTELVTLVGPFAHEGRRGRPPPASCAEGRNDGESDPLKASADVDQRQFGNCHA